jgi:hypothetical protein
LVALLKVIYSSIQISDVLVLTVCCKLITFVFQIFPVFIPEMPSGFTLYMDTNLGTWNVRSMNRAGSLRVVGEEI